MQTSSEITSENFSALIEQVKNDARKSLHEMYVKEMQKFLKDIKIYFCFKFSAVQSNKMNVSLKFNRKDFLKDFAKDQELINMIDRILNNLSGTFLQMFLAVSI
ncbi:hypothetical protein [Acinetobacter brisouii]|uniref:hypothetical protein n=1 Tax=Acinetobacter brisouii TaxID=396323 RepID=UPI00124E36B7|nr:hypothetical protein [Acinetobacter brisouii]